jgi:hypothetical protein
MLCWSTRRAEWADLSASLSPMPTSPTRYPNTAGTELQAGHSLGILVTSLNIRFLHSQGNGYRTHG